MKKRLKTIAMYLPQFHRVLENDKWWGDGFTEWTTVKAGEKLFEGHIQPRVPLNNNYYDLLNKQTIEWQVNLAREYGVDGFCFYHYYFKAGKKILERPIENLLQWKDINISYCFCWANQTWARTWSNLYAANSWSEKFEPKQDGTNSVLLEQDYGGEPEWKKHFEYLLPFFRDERYIKVGNKPIFLFYVPEDIIELDAMLKCWNKSIKQYGYAGIYAVAVNSMKLVPKMSARLLQGPNAFRIPTIAGLSVKEMRCESVKVFEYQECWENAISVNSPDSFRSYYGGFVDYDDTPRRGKLGICARGASPDIFGKYLYKLAIKNIVQGNHLLFINAWNEWGEGNYLEPDENNKFKFLEKVRDVMERCNDEHLDVQKEWNNICVQSTRGNDTTELLKMVDKYRGLCSVLNCWLALKEHGINLEGYFLNRGYNKILIYGMAELGKHLYEELLYHGRLEIIGALDQRQGIAYKELKIYGLEEEIPKCDVIVVTTMTDHDIIKKFLTEKVDASVVFLKDIVYTLVCLI